MSLYFRTEEGTNDKITHKVAINCHKSREIRCKSKSQPWKFLFRCFFRQNFIEIQLNSVLNLYMIRALDQCLTRYVYTVKIQSKYSQITVKVQLKYRQNTDRIQSKYSQNTVRIPPEYSENTVKIRLKVRVDFERVAINCHKSCKIRCKSESKEVFFGSFGKCFGWETEWVKYWESALWKLRGDR